MPPAQLLVFGPHPDDLEIGMGGTIVRHASRGATVGLCDLTRGELGSNGTPDDRVAEAQEASNVLGAAWRVNLSLPDGGLSLARDQRDAIIDLIRRTQPDVVAIPHGTDRHPDHVAAHALLLRALFDSGLRRIVPGLSRGGPAASSSTSSTTPGVRRCSWTSPTSTNGSARHSPAIGRSSRRTTVALSRRD